MVGIQEQIMRVESNEVYVTHIRPSKEFMFKINKFRARCLLNGKRIPTMNIITKKISLLFTDEALWNEFF
jgi:hypothetical protein